MTPYEFTIAVAENAADNGVDFKLSRSVVGIEKSDADGTFTVNTVHRSTIPTKPNVAMQAVGGVAALGVAVVAWAVNDPTVEAVGVIEGCTYFTVTVEFCILHFALCIACARSEGTAGRTATPRPPGVSGAAHQRALEAAACWHRSMLTSAQQC